MSKEYIEKIIENGSKVILSVLSCPWYYIGALSDNQNWVSLIRLSPYMHLFKISISNIYRQSGKNITAYKIKSGMYTENYSTHGY